MSRIRITCKSPTPIERKEFVPGYPCIMSMPASWADVSVTLISDDGSEHEITNVEGISWCVKQGNEPASATLEFLDVDVDVEADLDPDSPEARAFAKFIAGADGKPRPLTIKHPDVTP